MSFSARIGEFQVDSLSLDRFKLDGGAMFGVVPKTLWEKSCPADSKNRIEMGCQSILLRRPGQVILVDAGLGNKWDQKGRDIYAIEESPDHDSPLAGALAAHAITPQDVTDVIVTHLHFDHAGGLTYREGDQLHCTFPNATHWVQAAHLDWARSPSEKDRGSFPSENIEPLVQADLFGLVRGEEQLFSGISVVPLHGHTKAMQAVLVAGDRSLFFPADLLPMSAHVHLPYIMAYDVEPLTTLKEKKQILSRAVKEGWLVTFEHEPEQTLGVIEMFGGKYRLGRE